MTVGDWNQWKINLVMLLGEKKGNVKNVRPVDSQTSYSMTPSADRTPVSATKYISFALRRHGENYKHVVVPKAMKNARLLFGEGGAASRKDQEFKGALDVGGNSVIWL